MLFHAFDLDREGGQWQQTGTLLERVGLPDALELWEASVLEEGAKKGDFTEADLDALMGGELALVVTPRAVELAVEHHERHQQHGDDDATPMAGAADEPHGVTAVLLRATLTRPGTTSNGRLRTWRPSTTYRSRRSRTGAASCSGSRCPIRASA